MSSNNRLKRILFWQESFWPNIGGTERIAAKLLPALKERGFEFIVVTRRDNPQLPQESMLNGIPVHRFPFYHALESGNLVRIAMIQRQIIDLKNLFKPNLIHVGSLGPSLLFHMQTARIPHAPMLVTVPSFRYSQMDAPDSLLGQVVRSADWITCVSSAVRKHISRRVPGTDSRMSVIYNALKVPSIKKEPPPADVPRILFIGRLIPEKGCDLALKAFSAVIQSHPDARLMIAGDGEARSMLEKHAASLNITGSVDFIGAVNPEKVSGLIKKASLVVMPSRCEESFGLVALEAALLARPVVASRVGGLTEVVVNQETGLLVKKDDAGALADAFEQLLDNPEKADRLGWTAHNRAVKIFNWDKFVDAYDTLYRKLIRGA